MAADEPAGGEFEGRLKTSTILVSVKVPPKVAEAPVSAAELAGEPAPGLVDVCPRNRLSVNRKREINTGTPVRKSWTANARCGRATVSPTNLMVSGNLPGSPNCLLALAA